MNLRLVGCLALAALGTAVVLARAGTPATMGDRGVIVYWSGDPFPSIWAVRPDGSKAYRILRNQQNAKRPRLSPDRAWVAFDGAPPGKRAMSDFDIQLVHLDGTGLRTLTTSADWDTDAQWSPDGRWLSFTRSPPSPMDCTGSAIWVMRNDGSDARRVAPGCGARWSRDGRRLVYSSVDGDLFVVDLQTEKRQRLLATPAYEDAAGWSPNGKKILFTRMRAGESGDVFVMNADGSGARRLAHGVAGCWSPDGRKILYTRFFASPLYVMDANGKHKHRLVQTLASEPDWR